MSAHLSTTQPSIRASCERCRLHKLKCIASSSNSLTNEARCQRCIRAATECVFSRRSSSKRRQASSEDIDPLYQNNTLPAPSLDESALMRPTMSFDLDEGQSDNPGLNFSSSNTYFTAQNPALHYGMGLIDPKMQFQLPVQSLNNQSLHLSHSLGVLTPESETAGLVGNETSSSLAGSSASSMSTSTVLDGQQMYPRRVATKSLLTLAMTLEETLDKLANQTWEQEANRSSFDHYPVGSVLHLFQEFIDTIAGLGELRSRDHLRNDQQDFKHGTPHFYQPKADESTAWRSTAPLAKSTPKLDTSLVLLVLSCYATLTRIGTTVLGHFKQHLEGGNAGQRDDVPAAIVVDKCSFTATTQLSELATQAKSYTQIHAAVNLLLELLERATCALAPLLHNPISQHSSNFDVALAIEAQMQLADKRTAPLRSCLRESAAGLLSSFAEREENSSELKDLLRRKMGL
ncbi:hypothetical protein GGR51DRAFT_556145 [Nemania sp. FL0031]|nr:hypothetical protein GGR51DRAFT_556145 [Nemania sp. FL0031]